MRTADERLAAVERRVRELEHEKRQRKYRYISISAAAACLVLFSCLGISIPGIMPGLSGMDYSNGSMTGSIFYQGKVLDYVFIGFLSFVLGVCLTILCFLLKPGKRHDKENCKNDRTR